MKNYVKISVDSNKLFFVALACWFLWNEQGNWFQSTYSYQKKKKQIKIIKKVSVVGNFVNKAKWILEGKQK